MCQCFCPHCTPFGPTREEHDRRFQEYLDAEVARIRTYFDSPEGQATIERNLRKIGWQPTEEARSN